MTKRTLILGTLLGLLLACDQQRFELMGDAALGEASLSPGGQTVSAPPGGQPVGAPPGGPPVGAATYIQGNPCNSNFPTIYYGAGIAGSGDCTILEPASAGGLRQYRLHVPPNYRVGSPLVVLLHGSGNSGPAMETTSGFSAKSDAVGAALAYPTGLVSPSGRRDWNRYWINYGWTTAPDDTLFIRDLITNLSQKLQIDQKRIFVTGFSAGAFMSHRLGIELSDVVAAIAPVEGLLFASNVADPRSTPPLPANPVPTFLLMGASDPLYCNQAATGPVARMDDNFNFWASANGCTTLNTTAVLCTPVYSTTAVTFKQATNCQAGATVTFYKLIGGSHYWQTGDLSPGNPVYNPLIPPGTSTNDLIWNFFIAHPKP